MLGVTSAELTPQLSAAVFAAKAGALSGPVKTAFGYYVFTVDRSCPAKVADARRRRSPSIKALLSQQQVSAARPAAERAGEEVEAADELPQRLLGHLLRERAEGLDRGIGARP